MGYVMVRPDALAERLMPALEEQLALAAAPCTDQVTHARRLVAAGEIAVGLQHALNNPLAGIMAEAQLMQLESPSPDQAAALERIVTLCRRMVDLTHALDGVGSKKR
jgi:signal transduction histidine kinase